MAEHDEPGDDGRPLVTIRTMEIVVAAIVLTFGLAFLYSSYRLGFRWAIEGPQSGFFPFYVSLFICVASAVILLQAIIRPGARGAKTFVDRGPFRQVLKVLIPAVLFVVGIQVIGIYVSSAIYIALFMHFLGDYPWKKSVPLAIGIAVFFFLLFEVWFQVPLFKGYFNPTAWTGY